MNTTAMTSKPAPIEGLHERAQARQVAGQFEALFVNLLLSRMKETLNEGFFGEGTGSHVQSGMFASMLSRQITGSGPGLGLADRLLEDWQARGYIKNDRGPETGDQAKQTTLAEAGAKQTRLVARR